MCFAVIKKEGVGSEKSDPFIWIEKKSLLYLQRFLRKVLQVKGV